MAIAGKPIYAGSIDALAQLDLSQKVAQDRATQAAISSSGRGVQNLLNAKQQQSYEKLKSRELDIQEKRFEKEDTENAERYTFDEVMRGIDRGIIGADEIDSIIPEIEDPGRKAALGAARDRIRGIDALVESEGPGAAKQLNELTAWERQQYIEARNRRQTIESGGGGWFGTSFLAGDLDEAKAAEANAQQALARRAEEFGEGREHFGNRIQLDAEGNFVFTAKPSIGGGRGSTETQPSAADAATATEPLPPPPQAGRGVVVPPRDDVLSADLMAPGQQPPIIRNMPSRFTGEDILPEDAVRNMPATLGGPQVSAEDALQPMGRTPIPVVEAAPDVGQYNIWDRITGQEPVDPAKRQAGYRGVGPYGRFGGYVPPERRSAPTEIAEVKADPVTGEISAVDASGAAVDLTDRLTPELKNQFYSRIAELQREGLSSDEAVRRAGLWLYSRINAEAR